MQSESRAAWWGMLPHLPSWLPLSPMEWGAGPALLRCRRIDFSIPEQFGGGDMGWLGCTLVFRPGLLRPPRTFAIGLEAYLLGQLPQRGDHRSGTHTAEDLPLILRDRNHHAMIGLGDVVGAIVEGE